MMYNWLLHNETIFITYKGKQLYPFVWHLKRDRRITLQQANTQLLIAQNRV